MFVLTFRKGGLKKAAIVCACGVLLAASAIGISALRGAGTEEDAAPTAAEAAPAMMKTNITGATDLGVYLQGFGVQPDVATAAVNRVTIPRKWDDNFKAFNEVIKESGLDLSKYKGKKADKWMVVLPAQSNETEKTYAVVLVYKEEPIAAYLLQKPSGEVLALKAVAATAAPLTDEEIAAGAAFGEGVTEAGAPAEQPAAAPAPDAAACPTE